MRTSRFAIIVALATLAAWVTVPGCVDEGKVAEQRAAAVASRDELAAVASTQEETAQSLEARLADLQAQARQIADLMAQAEPGGADWLTARQLAVELDNQAAMVRAAIAAARDAVRMANERAAAVAEAIKKGDAVLAESGEGDSAAVGAAGAVANMILPGAGGVVITLLAGLPKYIRNARAARVYRGERDQLKAVGEAVVRSIEVAKTTLPKFADAFKEAAPVIDKVQRSAVPGGGAKDFVDTVQVKG